MGAKLVEGMVKNWYAKTARGEWRRFLDTFVAESCGFPTLFIAVSARFFLSYIVFKTYA